MLPGIYHFKWHHSHILPCYPMRSLLCFPIWRPMSSIKALLAPSLPIQAKSFISFGWFTEWRQLSEKTSHARYYATVTRPPVVAIMGHVDHGKTTILDWMRKSNIVAGEAGGITQHIGAFTVHFPLLDSVITFLDTPGHAAFKEMRGRGAQVVDIIILVISLDDGIMPQTIESIEHAKTANVPIIVALNKCDKFEYNAEKVKRDLLQHDIVVEDMSGDTQAILVSGLTGKNMENLVTAIQALTDILDLRANVEGPAKGVVIESRTEVGVGPVATVLVKEGTLKRGHLLVCEDAACRIKALKAANGHAMEAATPSTAAEVIGWKSLPPVGAQVTIAVDEKSALELIEGKHREEAIQELVASSALAEQQLATDKAARNDKLSGTVYFKEDSRANEVMPLFAKKKLLVKEQRSEVVIEEMDAKDGDLPVILKCDVVGSLEAIRDALLALPSNKIRIRLLSCAVGDITISDMNLAELARASIITFNIKVPKNVKSLAVARHITIYSYNVIYKLLEDVEAILIKRLPPIFEEKVAGVMIVQKVFELNVKKRAQDEEEKGATCVAGCLVTDGVVKKEYDKLSFVRLVRRSTCLFEGQLHQLKHLKKDIAFANKGMECGALLENFNDVQEGDEIHYITKLPIQQTLS